MTPTDCETFLDGKVRRRRLPEIDPTEPDKPRLKRLKLPQGELAQFYDGESGGVEYLALLELVAGTVRGNHLHRMKHEFLYVHRGALELTVRDLSSGRSEVICLQAGDLAFVDVGVAHAMKVLESGHAIEFSKEKFDPFDVERFMLIQ